MFQVGGWEFLVILVVALIVLGPERLPGVARQVGQAIGTMRQMAQSFQTEFEQAIDAAETAARLEDDESETVESPSEPSTDEELVETEVSADQDRSPDAPEDLSTEEPGRESDGESVAADDVIETVPTVEASPEEVPAVPQRSPAAADVAALEPNRVEKPQSGELPPTAEPGAA